MSRHTHDDSWAQVLYKHTLGVLSDALALWPGVPVRVHYIDKLLSANQQQTVDPPPALLTGLQVMRRVLDAQVQSALGLSHGRCLWCFTQILKCCLDPHARGCTPAVQMVCRRTCWNLALAHAWNLQACLPLTHGDQHALGSCIMLWIHQEGLAISCSHA